MKSLAYLCVFFLLIASAEAVTLAKDYKKLRNYSASELQINAQNGKDQVNKKRDEILELIYESVTTALKDKEKITSEYLRELIRVAVITFDVDPSLSTARSIFPLYKKHKEAVENAIKSLPAKDAERFNRAIKNLIREEKEGNG